MGEAKESTSLDHRKGEEFARYYANNVYFESNAWDLTIKFGQSDPSQGPNVIVQHAAVTLPWPQIKVMLYFLQLHFMAYEADHGRCKVPKGVIPAPPSGADSGSMFRQFYDDFIAANPEAAP